MGRGGLSNFRYAPIIAISVAACSSLGPVPDVPRLEVDASSYVSGDTVQMLLVNNTERRVHYNYCFQTFGLQRQIADAWRSVTTDMACLAIDTSVAPGDTVRKSEPVGGRLSPGLYRYSTSVFATDPTKRWTLESPQFVVLDE